jgi:hypothetical protein
MPQGGCSTNPIKEKKGKSRGAVKTACNRFRLPVVKTAGAVPSRAEDQREGGAREG